MLQSDLIFPWRSTTDLSKHSIAHFRGISNDFMVNEFISILERVDHMCISMFQSNISCVHLTNKKGEDVATIAI